MDDKGIIGAFSVQEIKAIVLHENAPIVFQQLRIIVSN
jgi:hypothetical protein